MSDTLDLSQPGHDLRLMNPPAFGHGDYVHGGEPGMSLRDYFAGQALVGLAAQSNTQAYSAPNYLAELAYNCADAMLEARQQ